MDGLMENPIKMDDLGVLFSETSIYIIDNSEHLGRFP